MFINKEQMRIESIAMEGNFLLTLANLTVLRESYCIFENSQII